MAKPEVATTVRRPLRHGCFASGFVPAGLRRDKPLRKPWHPAMLLDQLGTKADKPLRKPWHPAARTGSCPCDGFEVHTAFVKRVCVTGIVKVADRVRQELAGPVSAGRLSQLREGVGDSLRTIDRLLAEAGAGVDAMPAPSRRAYQFLAGIDYESIATEEAAASNGLAPNSVTFPGLRSYLDAILDDLASGADGAKLQEIRDSIRRTGDDIERQIGADGIGPEQIKSESRAIRGWLAYFRQGEHFDAYLAALGLAGPILEDASGRSKTSQGVRRPLLVHFRPMRGLFRIRVYTDSSRVQLPTGMICFDEDEFGSLADLAFGGARGRQAVLDAMLGEPYQAILFETDLLSGLTERSGGVYHDLAASFGRVNAAYFGGGIPSPRLSWSRTFTARKFGGYERTRDMLMVSSTLDRRDVPACAVDFIVYHELLHKKLGVRWTNGRMAAHTPEFLRAEKLFRQYGQAKAVLRNLAGSEPSPTAGE